MGKYITQDERCANGVVIHWSQRTLDNRVPVTYRCGHVAKAPSKAAHMPQKRRAKGLCASCTMSRPRPDKRGAGAYNWKNGVHTGPHGYIYVLADDPLAESMKTQVGYVLEHRLVMAQHLGRPLGKHEIVHHLNSVRDDNRIENLMLMPSNSAHSTTNMDRDKALRLEIRRLQGLLDQAGVEY